MLVTVHSKHITPCQVIRVTPKQTGWNWILENWHSPVWIACPEWVKSELRLHPMLGVCSGMLITKGASLGLNEFIRKVNHA